MIDKKDRKYCNKLFATYIEMHDEVVYYTIKKGEVVEPSKLKQEVQHYKVDVSDAKIPLKLYMCESICQQFISYIDVFVYPEIKDTEIIITTDGGVHYEFNTLELITQADITDYLINL